MGAFLDKPETAKETRSEEGNGIQYSVCSMQGWRHAMEDNHCAKIGLNEQLKDWSFFAVFDGHAGQAVSNYCAEHLLDYILQSEEFKKSVSTDEFGDEQIELAKKGIKNGFLKLDRDMKDLPELVEKKDKSGSTAVCCLVSPKHFFFINCGDSRAVLSRDGQVLFSTNDHKPFNRDEKERIQKAGGSVMIQRVNGSLAVSRALGDYEYKQNEDRTDCEQLVSPEPEINVIERDNSKDEFIILACDGIFDVISNENLCTYVRYLYETNSHISSITSPIVDTCLHKGSLDNMTLVLVTLPAAPKRDKNKAEKDKNLEKEIIDQVEEYYVYNEEGREYEDILKLLEEHEFRNLPPAIGLDAKKNLIAEIYSKLSQTPMKYTYHQPMIRDWSTNEDESSSN